MKNKVNFVWETISLRTKLTALSIALIGILLAVSSIGTIALLRTYLQTNADTLLTSTATTLRDEDPAQLESRLALHQLQLPALPSDFYIAYVDMDGQLLIGLVSSADDSQGVPNLSNFNADFVSSTQGIPFNADSGGNIQDRPSRTSWRMVAVPLTDMPGSLVVALPTASNDALINQYSSIGTGFALAFRQNLHFLAGGHQRISAALDGPAAVVAVAGLQAGVAAGGQRGDSGVTLHAGPPGWWFRPAAPRRSAAGRRGARATRHRARGASARRGAAVRR